MDQNENIFRSFETGQIVLFDRREDPITPLLHQWTYQAMVHELLNTQNNTVTLENEYGKKEVYLMEDWDDDFYRNNLFSDFGEVASNAKEMVDKVKEKSEKIDTIDEMRRMIDSIPKKKKESAQLTKHISVIGDLKDSFEKGKILEISNLQQEIASNQSKDKHLQVCF